MPGLRKITANSATWFIGQIVTKLSGLVLVIFAARLMGEEQFGKFTVVMAYYVIVNVAIDFGLRPLVIREVARDPGQANSYLLAACLIKLVIHAISLVLIWFLLSVTGTARDTGMSVMLSVVALLPFTISQTFSSMYMAMERMYYEALIVMIGQILWMITVIIMLLVGYQLVDLFVALIAVNCIILLLNSLIFMRRFFRPVLSLDMHLVWSMARESLPFALTSAFAILYFRIDTLMLSWMRGDVEVSWYGVAYRMTDAVNFVPIALMVSVYPIVSRLYTKNRDMMRIVVERSYYYLFVLGLPISAGLALSSEKLITLFFKNQYQPSIAALSILSWSLLPLFLNAILITTLNSANRQNIVTRATLVSLVVNIVGNILVIPSFGFYGACVTTILSEYVILVLLRREIRHLLGFRLQRPAAMLSPIVATAIMVLVFSVFNEYNVFILIGASVFIYLLTIMVTRGLSRADLSLFRQALLEKEVA